MLTVGSLFAGIGGFDLGFERAGFEIKWQVEIDDYASRVLAKHWPHVRRYGDIRAVDWATVEPVDVVCGGFPCQPHSLAGTRRASADERDLWGEFARTIRELQPRWVVAENVPGLLSSESGRFFGRVLGDLAACGYDAEWDCLPASAFGAHHRRDRVWVVAYPSDDRIGWRQQQPEGCEGARDVAHPNGARSQGWQREELRERAPEWLVGARGAFVADSERESTERRCDGPKWRQRRQGEAPRLGWERAGVIDGGWFPEPNVGRVAHGVPARVDRLRGLGNSIVPQIAEWIAHRIKAAEGVAA